MSRHMEELQAQAAIMSITGEDPYKAVHVPAGDHVICACQNRRTVRFIDCRASLDCEPVSLKLATIPMKPFYSDMADGHIVEHGLIAQCPECCKVFVHLRRRVIR